MSALLKGRRIISQAWKVTPGSTGGGGITAFTLALSASSGRTGTPVTATVAPVGGVWPAAQVLTFSATTLVGTFSQTVVTAAAGTAASIIVTYTPTSLAGVSGTINASSPGLTNQSGARPYSITATAATGYTLSQSSNSGVTGQPHSLSLAPTPSGATWPAGTTITLAAVGLTGSFSPSAAVSPTGGTSGAATVTWTPGATGTATISATNNAGLTNPAALTYTAAASGAYTPPSDIIWTQPVPASTMMGNGGSYKPSIGQARVVGGVGPFVYGMVTDRSYYDIDHVTGCVYPPYLNIAGAPTDTCTLQCTDALGNFVQKQVTILKNSDPVIWVDQPFTRPANTGKLDITVVPLATGHSLSDTVVLNDPSRVFKSFYAYIEVSSPPAGSYPMTLTATSAAGTLTNNFTINLIASTIGPALFQQNVVSDSVPVGFEVGRFFVTTPNNTSVVTMTADSSGGRFAFDSVFRRLQTTAQLVPGTYSVTFHVDDNGLTSDFTYSIPVQVGVTLASSAMTMTVNSSLDNSRLNQTIGTPSVAGMTAGTWYMVQSNYVYEATVGFYGNKPPFKIDPVTGQITNPDGLLSCQSIFGRADDVLTITRSDGITSCTRSFTVPVSEPATTLTVWVGPGMAAAHPGFGYEGIYDAWLALLRATVPGRKVVLKIRGDGDYMGQGLGGDIRGPVRIEPELVAGQWPVTGNHQSAGKAMWLFDNGDVEFVGPFEVKDVNGGNSTSALGGVRKEGNSYGNILMQNLLVHDCDIGFQSGHSHAAVIIKDCEFYNGGTAHSSGGNMHNIYINSVAEAIIDNLVSHHATNGHLLKCRAKKTTITNSRLFDGSIGNSVCCVDLPDFGEIVFANNVVQKNAMSMNPYVVQVGAEYTNYEVNSFISHDNLYIDEMRPGTKYFPGVAIGYYWTKNALGVPSTGSSTNDTFFLLPGPYPNELTRTYNFFENNYHPQRDLDPAHALTVTNPTIITLPPALDLTTATWKAGVPVAVPGRLWRKLDWGEAIYTNFNGVQQLPSKFEHRVAHTAGAGIVIDTIFADDTPAQGDTHPFGPGTTWSIQAPALTGYTNVWAPAGMFTVTTNLDGSGTPKTGTLGAAGVYFVELRATSPDGTRLCDATYPIVVT